MKSKLSRISVTEAADFQSCRRYWYLANYAAGQSGYESKSPGIPLWLGWGVHEGLEAYFRSERDPVRCLGVYDDWYRDFVSKTRLEFEWVWDALQIQLHEMYMLGRGMLENFCTFDESGASKLYGKIYKVEKRIEVPILNPSTGRRTRAKLSGKIDLILERDDGLWVVDHKTYGSSPRFEALDIDDQMTGYAYLVWRDTGIVPAGIIYNCLIKAKPSPPDRLKNGGFSKSKSQPTTYSLYRQALEAAGESLLKYADVLNYFAEHSWENFFAQEESFRNEDELRAYGEWTYYRMKDMSWVLSDPEHLAYPMGSTRGCGWCSFRDVCKSSNDGGDPQALLDNLFTVRKW